MVALGGVRFLMSEVSLYSRSTFVLFGVAEVGGVALALLVSFSLERETRTLLSL
jgi:hypothetical protein